MNKPWTRRRRRDGWTEAFIYSDTYTAGFLLLAGVDAAQGNRLLLSNGFIDSGDEYRLREGFEACCIRNPGKGTHAMVLSKDCIQGDYVDLMATIAHEAVHLSNHILIPRGVRTKLNNDEPQAYFVSWAVRAILNTIKK